MHYILSFIKWISNSIFWNFLGTQYIIMNIRKRNEQNSDSETRETLLALLLTKLAQKSHLTSVRPSKNEMLPSVINSRIRNNKDPWGNSSGGPGVRLHALTVKGVGWPSRWGTKIPQAAQWSKSKKRRKEIKILAHCLTHSKHTAGFKQDRNFYLMELLIWRKDK